MSRPGVPAAGPTPIRSVTVAIPSCNGRRHLEACIPAVKRQLDPGVRWEVAVLDNASTDGTGAWLRRARPEVRVRRADRNLGFAAACNRLATDSEADAVAFLNDDALPREDRLAALVRRLNEAPSEVVAVGGLVLDWRGERLDFAGGIMTFDGHAFQHDLGRPLSEITIPAGGTELLFATGSNMLVRRREFLALGGFDPHYFAYLEDVDFGWRAWSAGHRILLAAEAVVHHRGSATGDRLGDARRGFLFERNAFMTAFKNYDDELWPRMLPPILMTLISRATGSVAADRGAADELLADPVLFEDPRETGAVSLARNLLGVVRPGRRHRATVRTEAHLRALAHIVRDLDRYATRRDRTQARRRRSDLEIFAA